MNELLPLLHPWAWALGACAVAAVAEGLLSGTKIKQRFAELEMPRYSLPLWAWSIIGVAYYALFFLVLHSVLGNPPTIGWSLAALAFVAAILAANAMWNWVFFRKKDAWLSAVLFVPYIAVAIALSVALFRLESWIAPWYLAYLAYLTYAAWWSYRVWRLNRGSSAAE